MTRSRRVDVRVFLSSPNELRGERLLAKEVMEQLNREELVRQTVRLVPLMWEDEVPPVVGMKPQAIVDYYLGRAREVDIFVCMLWNTIGSPCTVGRRRYESGTLYEFNDAYRSFRENLRPKVLLYRCIRPRPAQSSDDDYARVDAFFQRFRTRDPNAAHFEGILRDFSDGAEFAELLRWSLRKLALEIAARGQAEPRRSSPDGDTVTDLAKSVRIFLKNFDQLFEPGSEEAKDLVVDTPIPPRFVPMTGPDGPKERPPRGLLPGDDRSILDLYEQWGRRMLLLGQSGAGKTFAMLQLMKELVERADWTGMGSIPVYFDLSSWVATTSPARQPAGFLDRLLNMVRPRHSDDPTLNPWLEDELERRFGLSRKAARELLENGRITLCLDGLDELILGQGLGEEDRRAGFDLGARCVRSLNETIKDDRTLQVIFCCQDQTFDALAEKPLLGVPLRVQPLDRGDIELYLAGWEGVDGLRGAIAESAVLDEKARTPLFLSMMALAYAGMDKAAILAASEQPLGAWEDHLLHHFISQCISVAPPSSPSYSKKDIPRYLSWIAHELEPDFLIEDLQPSLLSSQPGHGDGWYVVYRRFSVGMLALVLTMAVTIPSALGIGVEWTATHSAREGARQALIVAATSGTLTLVVGLMAFAARRWWVFGWLVGVGFGIVRGTNTALSAPEGLGGTITDGLVTGLVTIPCATAVFLLFGYQTLGRISQYKQRYRHRPDIERFEILPLESFTWHWIDPTTYLRGGWLGLVIGPLIGALVWREFGFARGAGFGIIATLYVTVFSGLSGTGVRVSLAPNQGIERSLRHAMIMAGLFTLSGILAFGVTYGAAYGPLQAVVNSILGCALSFSFLVFGGIPVIRHVCLGHVLHLQQKLPSWICWPPWRKTVVFFNDMVRYKLLRRSAAGYRFRHEMLRRYYRRPLA